MSTAALQSDRRLGDSGRTALGVLRRATWSSETGSVLPSGYILSEIVWTSTFDLGKIWSAVVSSRVGGRGRHFRERPGVPVGPTASVASPETAHLDDVLDAREVGPEGGEAGREPEQLNMVFLPVLVVPRVLPFLSLPDRVEDQHRRSVLGTFSCRPTCPSLRCLDGTAGKRYCRPK